MNAADLFLRARLIENSFDNVLDGRTWETFQEQYLAMFKRPEANDARGYIYVFWTQLCMPRANEASNILRIGETNQTLHNRHSPQKSRKYYHDRWQFLLQTIDLYHGIRFSYAHTVRHKDIETDVLLQFRREHYELPPFNCKM